jgi:PAS domain S-box-containing protein
MKGFLPLAAVTILTMKNIRPQQQFRLSFCFLCKLHLFLLAFVSFFLFHSLTYATELKEEKRVLILFSNQSDLPAYPMVERGIKSSLDAGHEFHIEYFIEYMDYYRNPDQTDNQLLLDLYHHKFSRHKIDLVFAYGPPSQSLVVAHSNDLFPQTPVVFSGILREQLKVLNLSPMVTGVLLDIDYAGLLETALKIHPQTRHVAIVNGASKPELLFEKEFRKALEPYAKRLDFIYLTRLPMGKILERVQNLPEHSVVLYYILLRDGEGKSFIPQEVASILSEAANAPVYGCVDSYLGHGIVGGRLTSTEMTGVKAGEMALRILRGEKPSEIPMTSQGTIIDLFDWRQFKRFKIREDRLPPGSIVRFKTYSFWDLYRGYIVAAFFLILLQSGLISFLLWQRAQRRRAEAKYRTVADFTYDWEYWANIDDSLEYVSPSCERISGYTTSDFIDNPSLFKEIIVPEDRDVWDRHYHNSRKELKPREIQFRIQRRDGQIRWIEHNCQPVIGHQGRLQGFRAGNRDITSRKLVEERIREREKDLRRLATQLISAHEEERRSLARELHDDLSQRLAALAIQAGRMEQQAVNKHALDAEECCGRLKDGIIAISNDVHSLSRQLHPSILEDLGLTRAVESLCARFSDRERIEVAFTAENIPGTLSRDVSLSIYRIIQEGLNNIAKHACASRVKVALQRTDGRLCLSIQDDGIGFDAAEVRQKPGLGLSSMRERVRVIHGVLRITSEPENGTTITVRVPLEKSSRMEATPTDSE